MIPATFPYEMIPDGAVFANHHYYIGMGVAALAVASVWDDQRWDPLAVAVGLGIGLFGFALTWRYHPVTGATLALAGPTMSAGALARSYWRRRRRRAAWVLVGLLITLDDAIEHAFGVWTPLDALWVHHLANYVY